MGNPITVADIYCGIGGHSEGYKQAGHKVVFGLDIDSDCVKTFQLNNSEATVLNADIKEITSVPFEVDLVVGSPPCPTFSIANSKRESDLTLTKEFFRVMKLFKPKFWVMENVPPIRTFFPQGKILNAYDYGVPQKRERCFVSNFTINPKHTPKVHIKDVLTVDGNAFILDSRMAHFSEGKEEYPVSGAIPTLTTKSNGYHIVTPQSKKEFLLS